MSNTLGVVLSEGSVASRIGKLRIWTGVALGNAGATGVPDISLDAAGASMGLRGAVVKVFF